MKKIIALVLALLMAVGMHGTVRAIAEEKSLISIGDYNEDVIRLHQKLADLGYYDLRPESPWGTESEWALKVLQWNMDWEQTGVIENREKLDEILGLEHVVGKNLLADTDYYIEKDNKSTLVETKMFELKEGIGPQSLVNKTVTLSVYVNSPGERGTSLEDLSSAYADRFGAHGYLTWISSTGTLENRNTYPGTELLSQTVENNRISATFKVSALEGYETLSYVAVALQSGARPADDNESVWELGYPKLEICGKATDWIE